jgi:hypothetical protein
MDHVDVLICTPGRSMEAAYVRSLLRTVQELSASAISWRFLNDYSSLVHEAREMTISNRGTELNLEDRGPMADAISYHKMFWIDADIAWEPADFLRLYRAPQDVIAGIYMLKEKHPSAHGEKVTDALRTGTVGEVDSVGFGFVAVKAGVFEAIERPWFGPAYESRWLSTGKRARVPVGEDVSWCRKVRDAGFAVHLDGSVRLQHLKTHPVPFPGA